MSWIHCQTQCSSVPNKIITAESGDSPKSPAKIQTLPAETLNGVILHICERSELRLENMKRNYNFKLFHLIKKSEKDYINAI